MFERNERRQKGKLASFVLMLLIALMTLSGMAFAGDVASVSCGDDHTAVVKKDGTLWVCGDNHHGQLGQGDTNDRDTFVQAMTNVASVSCGCYHTAVVKKDGTLWVCGWNNHGQLGLGDHSDRDTFVQAMTNVASVSCGAMHTAVVKKDGTLWVCGENNLGELGLGDTTDRYTFVQAMTNVASVCCGLAHTAVVKKDGTLWVCGYNYDGEVGPTFVQAMTNVASVSCGNVYTAVVKKDGTLWVCGANENGQLGQGDTNDRDTFVQAMTNVASVSCGYYHTAVVKKDETLWVCGLNENGQLGLGDTNKRDTFVQVMTNVASVSCNDHQTAVVKRDGTLWVCGENDYGQLGDGTTEDKLTPVQITLNTSSIPDDSSKQITAPQTQPTAKTYTVTFNLNGKGAKFAKGAKKTIKVTNGKKYGTLPKASRTGYKLLGWFTKKKGGKEITKNTVVNLKKKTTLYAQWGYTVKFNANGGKIEKKKTTSKYYTKNQKLGKMPTPKRKGYKFLGWYTKKKAGKKVTKNTKCTNNQSLYAQWKLTNPKVAKATKMIDDFRVDILTTDDFKIIKNYTKIVWEPPYFILYKGNKSLAINRKALLSDKGYTTLENLEHISLSNPHPWKDSIVCYKVGKTMWKFQKLRRFVEIDKNHNISIQLSIEDSISFRFRSGATYKIPGTKKMARLAVNPEYFFGHKQKGDTLFASDASSRSLKPTLHVMRTSGDKDFFTYEINATGLKTTTKGKKTADVCITIIPYTVDMLMDIAKLKAWNVVKNSQKIYSTLTEVKTSVFQGGRKQIVDNSQKGQKGDLLGEISVGICNIEDYCRMDVKFDLDTYLSPSDEYAVQFGVDVAVS